MTLIDTFKEPCTLLEKRRVPDGEGGWETAWADGPEFEAAIVLDSSMTARKAEAEGVTALYTVTADRNVGLEFHDAFRRNSDGKGFRVLKVNDPTPGVASFQFSQYQAQAWEPTDGE